MTDWKSPELANLRQQVRKFLKEHIESDWQERDRSGEFPVDVFRKGCELGYFTCGLPEQYGALESIPALRIVSEELGRADPGFGLSVLAHTILFGFNIMNFGSEAQKQRLLPDIISGKKIGAWALTEPEIGSDGASIKTSARREGAHYYLSGEKTFITNAPIADYFIVIARTSGNPGQFNGISAFIVDRKKDGVAVGKPFYKLGHRTSPTSEIRFSNVELNVDDILGTAEKAFADAKHSLAFERLTFAGLCQGVVDACLDKATRYALEREQFGQPIAQFQLIQEKIANMVVQSKLLRAYADQLFDRYMAGEDVSVDASILKLAFAKASVQVASDAVQIFGGAGYLEESGVARYFRDAKLFEIGGGTNEIQMLIIAKDHLKKSI